MADIFSTNSIDVEVLRGGRVLPMQADGYVGRVKRGYVDLHVRIAEEAKAVAFMVDGNKGVVLKHETSWGDKRVVDPGRHYKLRMEIKLTNPPPESGRPAGIPHTEYPANALRLLEVRPDGSLLFFVVCVVSQHGDFFCIIQEQYEVACYDEEGAVRCPYFESTQHDWRQLRSVLPKVFEIVDVKLPPYEGQVAESDFVFPNLAPGTAGVEHWDAANQIGGIITDTGVRARVHWTNITRGKEHRICLVPGETVRYYELIPPVLTKERDTKYASEAKGVEVIIDGAECAA